MNKYARILVAVTILFGLGEFANAELADAIVVTLPFEFVVAGKTLPAGTYRVSHNSGDSAGPLELTNHDNGTSILLLPRVGESVPTDKPQLTFQRVGEEHFLSVIQTTREIYQIPIPHSLLTAAAAKPRNSFSVPENSGNE